MLAVLGGLMFAEFGIEKPPERLVRTDGYGPDDGWVTVLSDPPGIAVLVTLELSADGVMQIVAGPVSPGSSEASLVLVLNGTPLSIGRR
jgi:hypothetical protein